MSRRRVSLCILALAGIASVWFAIRSGQGNSPAFLPAQQHRQTIEYENANWRGAGPRDSWKRAPILSAEGFRLHCAGAKPCASGLSIPVSFEPNDGQFNSRAKFVGRGAGMALVLTQEGIEVDVPGRENAAGKSRTATVQMSVGWAQQPNARFTWQGEQRLKTVSNYFVGRSPRTWHTNVPHFARATATARRGRRKLFELMLYGNRGGVEYDLRVPPGAEASKLRLRFTGAERIELAGEDAILLVGDRRLRMAKPHIYEELSGKGRKTVRGQYVLEADGSVGLKLGPHDPRATLVVDPSIAVTYASFLGGAGSETSGSLALDADGKVYVGGTTTSSTSFPETTGAAIGPVVAESAFYVAKIDPTITGANSLIYLTFIRGSGMQSDGNIAVDGAGDVAITGTTTSADFPVTGSSQPTNGLTSGAGNDMVVSEINAEGNQLNFSTYFGGSGAESQGGNGGIAIDSAGNVYIASDAHTTSVDTNSPDLPVTAGAFHTVWDGDNSDGFLAVFAPPAQAGGAASLTYCTYLGTNSAGAVGVGGIAVDSSGNAYIAGSTSNASNGFPVKNAFQSQFGGGATDAFVMKIAPLGTGMGDLVYATLLGGSGMDQAVGIAVDTSPAPVAYVTGETQSTDFPVNGTNAPYQSKLRANPLVSGSANAFLSVIAQDPVSAATSLTYSTYLGGSDSDSGLAIAVAQPGSVYVAGQTNSPDFPWRDNLQPFNGGADAFVAKFETTASGAASLVYSTPLGGTSQLGQQVSAAATAVATNDAGQVYVAGQTTAADFPTAITTAGAANGFQQTCTSCQATPASSDAFVTSISESSVAEPSVYFNLGSESFPNASIGTQYSGQPLAVLNGGEQTLTISDIELLGPNAADFSLQGQAACIGAAISPGPSPQCSMDVNFTPSAGGPEEAFVAVWDNAPGSPQILELTGTGEAPHALIVPLNLDFGSQPVNSQSNAQTITITNSGTQNLTISELDTPAASTGFSPQGQPNCGSGSQLAPGTSCVIGIVFDPQSTGTFQGQVSIFDNSDLESNAEQIVMLTGTGVPPAPVVQVQPLSLSFGVVQVGTSSGVQVATLTNQGSAALSISGIAIDGPDSADFTIDTASGTCPVAGGTLDPGVQCTVAVRFAPQSAGSSKSASLSFADNAADSPQTVALSGSASSPAVLQVSPASLDFGSQSEGTTSAAQNVTIENTGTSAAGITGISIAGSSDFAEQDSCPPVLDAGKQCQISVAFDPAESAQSGARSATLNVPGGTPASVSLSGTATQAAISFASSVNFASQLVGTAGAPQPIKITNSSSGALGGALTFTGISIAGTNKTDFSITANGCGGGSSLIQPGNSCTVQVVFQAQAAATCGDDPNRIASLELQDNAPGSPQMIALSGPAADFCIASANGQPVSNPIQPGQTATFPLAINSSGGFTGTVDLSCSAQAGIGPCSISATPASNPPSVQVAPGTPGQFTVAVPTVAPSTAFVHEMPPLSGGSGRLAGIALASALALLVLLSGCAKLRDAAHGCASQKAMQWLQAAALLIVFSIGIAGCASGGGDPAPSVSGTLPGTYTVTVTATTASGGNSISRAASLQITVN